MLEGFSPVRTGKKILNKVRTVVIFASFAVLLSGNTVFGYPNGPVHYVTDIGPYCAACHASVNARRQMPEKNGKFVENWTIKGKHLRMLNKAPQYKSLSAGEKKQLIRDIMIVDANASIEIDAPRTVKPGEIVEVKVTAVGGAGPVVGIALVDSDSRFQARPISSSGWYIEGAPEVKGPPKPKGSEKVDWKKNAKKWGVTDDEWKDKEDEWQKWKDYQTKWVDKRMKNLDDNLNFVLVYEIKSDIKAKKFSKSEVTWKVRTPLKTGKYTMAAVFFYGTEKASPIGTVKKVGHNEPRGGFGGGSGRIKFSELVTITVK